MKLFKRFWPPRLSLHVGYYASINRVHAVPPDVDLRPLLRINFYHAIDTATGRYVWDGSESGLHVGNGLMNTVVTVQGYQSTTIFCNGVPGPEIPIIMGPMLEPQLTSSLTDIT